MKFNTKTIHGGQIEEKGYGAVMPPIYQTSTYSQKSPGDHKGYEYSRTHNPTRSALEKSLASIEGGEFGLAFGSGLAAIDAVLKLLNPGDEIISTNDLYGGSYRLFTKIFEKYGLVFHFTEMDDLSKIESLVNNNTKMIWVETPTNPMMNIVDIKGLSNISKKFNLILAVDNTFATPFLQQPLLLGADIVMHSATKYLAGHSDVVLGALIVNDKELSEQLYFIQNASGAICGPMDSFLTLRGIKTLHVRMERHCENAEKIANYLKSNPEIESVYWPGFKTHPNHEIAKKQQTGFGGIVSFEVSGGRAEAFRLINNTKMISITANLGDTKTTITHPSSTTHVRLSDEEKRQTHITENLIRISVGLEDIGDIIADIRP